MLCICSSPPRRPPSYQASSPICSPLPRCDSAFNLRSLTRLHGIVGLHCSSLALAAVHGVKRLCLGASSIHDLGWPSIGLALQHAASGFCSLSIQTGLQVLFNYGPNYIATYCNPVGTDYLAQSTTAPGFGVPNSNPPQPVGSHSLRTLCVHFLLTSLQEYSQSNEHGLRMI